jgi:sodium-dependent dicarboxylate transporter 2/3/5
VKASLGGMATLVGTPPNLAFTRIFAITFPETAGPSFGAWIMMGLPLTGTMLALVWLLLTRVFFRIPADLVIDRSILEQERAALGPMIWPEKAVLVVFSLTALLWIFRVGLQLGSVTIPGWDRLLPHPELIDDGTVAVAMALLLFLIPNRQGGKAGRTLMSADGLRDLPWHIVLLFGGGFALAKGFQVSGLAALIGEKFVGLAGMSPVMAVASTCFTLTFLTEVTSNTATTQMILPILASLAVDLRLDPLVLMIPATLSASCAFMMPVATPPNAIVFGCGRLRIADMARVGFFINLLGVVLITLFFLTLGKSILGIDLGNIWEGIRS